MEEGCGNIDEVEYEFELYRKESQPLGWLFLAIIGCLTYIKAIVSLGKVLKSRSG